MPNTKKYDYEDDRTFQLALKFYNRRWQKSKYYNTKIIVEDKQKIYIEKISMHLLDNTKCRKCRDCLSGVKYYANRNKSSDLLCKGCLSAKLKKEVGTDRNRILQELQWLGEHELIQTRHKSFSEHMVH